MKNLLDRLLSLGLSLVSGVLAGAMFKGVWKLITREDDAPQATDPQATDPQRSWKEILPAAALQGAAPLRPVLVATLGYGHRALPAVRVERRAE